MPQEKIKITRTLFVGLGGTGVKAILRTKQCFMDAYGDIPPMVAFLAIDTDKKTREQRNESRKGKDVTLTDNEICFCPIDGSATDIYLGNQNEFGWMPKKNAYFLQKLKNEGAGQIRTNGRFLARYNAVRISEYITSKVNAIGAPLPLDCKFEYDMNSQGMQYPTNINVVGSIAGGTGSGLMIDIINLVAHTMNGTGLAFRVFPWMVLPDVFRHMAPGVASQNVYANAYGVLTEMDYLYHLDVTNNNPLNFGFANLTSLDGSVYRTAVFNNKNKAGIVFQSVDEITDAIGRCMFLPANGVDGTSIEDNLQAASFAYNVRNKKANYSSAGCSELVYDNQAVGDVITRSIISDFCQEETRPTNSIDALQAAANWASSEAVGIEEHGVDVDLLTDSLLSKDWTGQIAFDRRTDASYIKTCIQSATEAEYVLNEVRRNFESKKSIVITLLDDEIDNYLTKPNGVGAVISFLEALLIDIEQSKREMISEKQECMDTIAANEYTNWDAELSNIRRPFYLGGGIDEDNANALFQTVSEHIALKRDNLRHGWAIQFYTDFATTIEERLATYRQFRQILSNISDKQKNEILSIQRKAKTESKFQIYLHGDDVNTYNRPNITSIITAFQTNNSIKDLIGSDQEHIERVFWDFAKVMPEVVRAVDITIEDKLSRMPDTEVKDLINHLKNLASPMWNTNLGRYVTKNSTLSGIFAIGCYDALNGILQEKYKDQFRIGPQDASFVTTRQTDRILLYRIECYSPIYAVNNLAGYKREAEEALDRDAYPVYYIDEQWHQRMEVEKFDIYPKSVEDKVLPNWVMAIAYNYIQYDQVNKNYYIMSEKQGDILRGGYLPLGARRDVAFDAFQNMGLYEEIEDKLQKMILEKGRPQVDSILKNIKSDIISYVDKYALLSDIELDMVQRRDSAYQMVIDLLVKEVNYLRSLSL